MHICALTAARQPEAGSQVSGEVPAPDLRQGSHSEGRGGGQQALQRVAVEHAYVGRGVCMRACVCECEYKTCAYI